MRVIREDLPERLIGTFGLILSNGDGLEDLQWTGVGMKGSIGCSKCCVPYCEAVRRPIEAASHE
jgi:hypothetical protein